MRPAWKEFEHYVQGVLGLDSTPASGNQFNAPGDAVDHRHPAQSRFPLLVDCKFTEHLSMSLPSLKLRKWWERAAEMGKRPAYAIRFWPRGFQEPEDYVLLGMDDFAELLEMAQRDDIVR